MPSEIEKLGLQAGEVLKNKPIMMAFEQLEKSYLAAIAKSKPEEKSERENLYFRIQALTDVRTALTIFENNGKVETSKAAKKEKATHGKRDNRKR